MRQVEVTVALVVAVNNCFGMTQGLISLGLFFFILIFCTKILIFKIKVNQNKKMNVKEMSLQDLESVFNLVCKIRESLIMMGRANQNMNTPQIRNINNKYNMLLKEINSRIDSIYEGEENNSEKELLND